MGEMERWELLYIKWQGLSTLWIPDLCYDVSGIGVGMVPLCATTNQLLLRIIPLLLSLLVHDWNFISNDWCLKANSEFLRLCLHCSWRFTVSPLHFSQYVPHWHVPCGPQKRIVPSFLVYQARRFLSLTGDGAFIPLSFLHFLPIYFLFLPPFPLSLVHLFLPPSLPPSLSCCWWCSCLYLGMLTCLILLLGAFTGYVAFNLRQLSDGIDQAHRTLDSRINELQNGR